MRLSGYDLSAHTHTHTTTNAGLDMGKGEHVFTASGSATGVATAEGVSESFNETPPHDPSYATHELYLLQRRLFICDHCYSVHNNQEMETPQMYISQEGKENEHVGAYTVGCYLAVNKKQS